MVAAVHKEPRFSRKWDYGIMATLAAMLLTSVVYIVTSEISTHDNEVESHPQINARITAHDDKLDRIEANQLREQAMAMAVRLCGDRSNQVYRRELARLITEWEKLTGEDFPRELLECPQ